MDVITRLWGYKKRECIENMKHIGSDKYASDPQYWTKSVLIDYQWFYAKKCITFKLNETINTQRPIFSSQLLLHQLKKSKLSLKVIEWWNYIYISYFNKHIILFLQDILESGRTFPRKFSNLRYYVIWEFSG